jgi:DNA-binding transcriptional LysR family regulator
MANSRRRRTRPPFQEPWPPVIPPSPPAARGGGAKEEGEAKEDLVGYRAPPSTWGGQRGASLLSGLGAKLRGVAGVVGEGAGGLGSGSGSGSGASI